MARTKKETDLEAIALMRHQELISMKKEIDDELKSLAKYLKAVGAVKGGKGGKGKAVSGKRTSATDAIVSAIAASKQGISIDQIMNQTGFPRQTVNGVLNRMKKAGKVKSAGRGIYVKA